MSCKMHKEMGMFMLVLLLFILLASNAYSIGISPTEKEIFFEPTPNLFK